MMVVPHEGTWIEILDTIPTAWLAVVVPHEGTWIEISDAGVLLALVPCRSPRGNVD